MQQNRHIGFDIDIVVPSPRGKGFFFYTNPPRFPFFSSFKPMDKPVSETIPFFDDLYPFTYTRPVTAIRIGILTLQEKWDRLLPGGKPAHLADNIVPDQTLTFTRTLQYPWQIVQFNAAAIADDFDLLTKGRSSQPIPASTQTINPEKIFIESGAVLDHTILNASAGPIYIGPNVTIMEGSIIRGPFAACEGSVIKMGTKIYGATTLGPFCTAGGEIKNSILFGYSNKAHDGYLGDSVLGEWCNLGAGTSNSNLTNSADTVKVWHQPSGARIPAGLKCGLLMGDYSRAAINTSFNTGTVVGVSCNVFGNGLTPGHIPSFSWGYSDPKKYQLDKALQHIANWKKLKDLTLTNTEIQILQHIFDNA